MRLVVWNCQGNAERKAQQIAALKPDIAVLSEVSPHCANMLANSPHGLGIGVGQHGLSIVGFNGWRILPATLEIRDRLFLPVVASKGSTSVQIIGACVKRAGDYVSPTLRMIETAAPLIRRAPTIVAGDFNQSLALNRTPSFQSVIDGLTEFQLRSAWHSQTGEEFGQESAPTYFHYKRDMPAHRFHIDYAFVPNSMSVKSARIGTFGEYVATGLSDHAPLVVEIE